MRAGIIVNLAAAIVVAGAADGQPTRPTPARHPPKCAAGERRVQVGQCSAPAPWKCEPCPHGARTLRNVDKCGAPIEFCRRAVGQ